MFRIYCWFKSVPRRSVSCVGAFSVVEEQRCIFSCHFTAKHLTMLGLFGVALSKRRAEKRWKTWKNITKNRCIGCKYYMGKSYIGITSYIYSAWTPYIESSYRASTAVCCPAGPRPCGHAGPRPRFGEQRGSLAQELWPVGRGILKRDQLPLRLIQSDFFTSTNLLVNTHSSVTHFFVPY